MRNLTVIFSWCHPCFLHQKARQNIWSDNFPLKYFVWSLPLKTNWTFCEINPHSYLQKKVVEIFLSLSLSCFKYLLENFEMGLDKKRGWFHAIQRPANILWNLNRHKVLATNKLSNKKGYPNNFPYLFGHQKSFNLTTSGKDEKRFIDPLLPQPWWDNKLI